MCAARIGAPQVRVLRAFRATLRSVARRETRATSGADAIWFDAGSPFVMRLFVSNRIILTTLFVASIALTRCGGNPVVSGTPPSGIGTGGGSGSGGARASGGSAGTGIPIRVGDAGMSGDDAGGQGGDAAVEPTCGDARLNLAFEVCDDGNVESSDGCTADCRQIEANYACPTPGEPCVSTVTCGDGKITGTMAQASMNSG